MVPPVAPTSKESKLLGNFGEGYGDCGNIGCTQSGFIRCDGNHIGGSVINRVGLVFTRICIHQGIVECINDGGIAIQADTQRAIGLRNTTNINYITVAIS